MCVCLDCLNKITRLSSSCAGVIIDLIKIYWKNKFSPQFLLFSTLTSLPLSTRQIKKIFQLKKAEKNSIYLMVTSRASIVMSFSLPETEKNLPRHEWSKRKNWIFILFSFFCVLLKGYDDIEAKMIKKSNNTHVTWLSIPQSSIHISIKWHFYCFSYPYGRFSSFSPLSANNIFIISLPYSLSIFFINDKLIDVFFFYFFTFLWK